MELLLVNHVITATHTMLMGLVQAEVITGENARDLLPLLVLHAIRNQNIDIEGV
jgi:hypothetical protein